MPSVHVRMNLNIRLHVRSMVEALSMIYAIEKINNSSLLQGIKLGYEIHDTCAHALKAVQSTLKFIPESATTQNSTDCSYENIGPIKAVVGETYSEISIAVSRILGLYHIPQISPASSAATLSDKIRFPSFLRTIPSDTHQTKAIVELIKTFQWNWVGIISSDDDYGRSAQDILNSLFKVEGICTAFSKTVPSYMDHPLLHESIESALADISGSSTNVVVVIAKGPIVAKLIKECIKQNIAKVWIASDSWSNSMEIMSIKNIEMAGTFLGLNFKIGYIMGFKDYLHNLQYPGQDSSNRFLEEYKELRFDCTEEYRKYLQCVNSSSGKCVLSSSLEIKSQLACQMDNLSFVNDDYLVENIEWSKTYSTHLAVIGIANALSKLLCTDGVCKKTFNFSPNQLLEQLKNGTFSFNGETVKFDSSGDVETGYDVITWHLTKASNTVEIIGKYEISESKISINRSLLQWNTKDNQVPFSNCSKSCIPGYYRKYSYISCCYECIPCPKDDYSPIADMTECLTCPSWQWSTNGSYQCTNRTIEFFNWKDPYAITLLAFSVLGVALVLMTIVLFIKHFNTPAVKAAGGYYTFLLNISLLINFMSIVFFIGEPNNTICKIRQPLYGISFTFSVSCIMIKSIRILLAFESAKRGKVLVKFKYLPIVIIIGQSGVQVLICTLWLLMNGPYRQDYSLNNLIIIKCDEGSYYAFGIMLGYIGLLALICFLLAYKGRKLPEKYNEARCITFSMLVYMFVWILFIPVYINTTSGMYDSAVQAVAILASIYGVIACHLLPGCYTLVFKRDTCTREKYLQSTFSFFRAKRKVQSFCKSKFNLEIPVATLKPDMFASRVPQVMSGSPDGVRKRHNSC
ncbi:G-protein coupled receptor family C group 6 member A-like [Dendropsophus ebraccatus]|uniref:G-protein coupled receptor family C group 6 member A-like n=1 Tax=Dendropsophus ebraccatus TaxID=150705 RepID=UPI0038321D85